MRGATVFSCAAARQAGARSCEIDARAAASASDSSRGGKRFGLDAARRLTQKSQFERLLREGRRKKVSGYTFYLEHRDAGAPRLGLLVTRTHAARSSERNRIKRCVREAFRLEQASLGPIDLLVRPPYGLRPSAQAIAQLRAIFSVLTK